MKDHLIVLAVGAAFLLVLFLGVGLAVRHEVSRQEKFMEECLQDHKNYECVAMWNR